MSAPDPYSAPMQVILAVDGPAGSGKSSVCRGVAQRAGLRYLDTGAMYRAMTWAVLAAGVHPEDGDAVADVARKTTITSTTDPVNPRVWVGEVDVSEPIRGREVTAAVSAVSAVPQVREILVHQQRADVAQATADGVGIVVEGRDIGSVVLPDADLKIFLTADPAERARRRAAEQQPVMSANVVDATKAAIIERDNKDAHRAVSPLTRAEDALEIDTTTLSLEDVIQVVLERIGDPA
jgi:CMP/dCMP kinase